MNPIHLSSRRPKPDYADQTALRTRMEESEMRYAKCPNVVD